MNNIEKILLYGSALWYLGEGMLGPLFAIFAERIGGDILEISWAWALYLILMGLLVIIIGKISDHTFDKFNLMMVGYLLNTIFTFAYLLVSKPLHLFMVQAGLGIAAALAIPTWCALYSIHQDRNHAGVIWGLGSGIDKIVTGIALIVGGFIVTYFSFNVLFLTMGTIQIFATIYQAKILKYRIPLNKKKKKKLK